MAGVSPQGWESKRLADVITDADQQLVTIDDPVTGEFLEGGLGSEDPAMEIVKVPLEGVGESWQAMQLVYQQFDPGSATGASLAKLVQVNGIEKLDSSPSIAPLTLGGAPGTVILAGQLVSDVNNVNQWATLATVTLDGMGAGSVQAACQNFGPVAALAGTLTNIVTPVPGWVSVTNPDDAILGRNVETDTELRIRRDRSTMAPAASPVESVYANLANVPGVTYARVRQNNTLTVDGNGIPGKSVAAVVVGGTDLDIAYVLLERTGIVAEWFGNTTVNLFDVQGETYAVSFTRPDPLPIYIELTIQVTNPSIFPVDGPQHIKDAILAYAIGGAPALGVDDGFSETGFPPGSPVLWSRLFTPVNFVPGHRVISMFIGIAPSPTTTDDIAVPWNEYAQFLDANIDITVAP